MSETTDRGGLGEAREAALAGGPARHHDKTAEQGKLPVRDRVGMVLDAGSFSEEAQLANWDVEGLGADGGEFVLAFDNGAAGEFNTLMVSDWLAHTPPEILAQNFGVPAEKFKDIPLDQLWIYQGAQAGPLRADQAYAASSAGRPDHPFIFRMGAMAPTLRQPGGEVRIVDSSNFPVSKTVAAAMVTLSPRWIRPPSTRCPASAPR